MQKIDIKLIEKIDSEGNFIYSNAFDLSDLFSINKIRKNAFSHFVYGFLVEKKENEISLPILEIIHAEENENKLQIDKFSYDKLPYQIAKNSILEVKNLLLEILIQFSCETEQEFLDNINLMLEEYQVHKQKKISKFPNFFIKNKKIK